MVFKHLDLFSGIGGFSLGLEATGGFETVAFCDIEEFPRKVLQKHWPDVKQYKDIKELTYERLKADGIGPIDIITGGYPCQPFSVAGRKKGEEDPRHLWPEMFRIIKECRPAWVIGENVAGHIKLGLDTVIKDLESEMYSARCFSIPASAVGANHKRERVWIVAYSERNHNFNEKQRVNGEKEEVQREHREDDSTARQSSGTDSVRETDNGDVVNTDSFRSLQHSETKEETSRRGTETSFMSTSDVADTDKKGIFPATASRNNGKDKTQSPDDHAWGCRSVSGGEILQGNWSVEPDVGRVAHGIPNRVDRLKSLGNSLIPHIPYYIGQSIIATYEDNDTV